jgi:hypothetical protein
LLVQFIFSEGFAIFKTESISVFFYWSIMSIAFGTVFLLGSIFMERKKNMGEK